MVQPGAVRHVTKKDGTKRFAIDYRGLNSVISLSSWPLPTMKEVLNSIAEQPAVYVISLDLRSGYWQAELDPATADWIQFQTHEGNYVFRRLPFGLCGAVQFLQMPMQKVLRSNDEQGAYLSGRHSGDEEGSGGHFPEIGRSFRLISSESASYSPSQVSLGRQTREMCRTYFRRSRNSSGR